MGCDRGRFALIVLSLVVLFSRRRSASRFAHPVVDSGPYRAGEIPVRRMSCRWVIPKGRFDTWLNEDTSRVQGGHRKVRVSVYKRCQRRDKRVTGQGLPQPRGHHPLRGPLEHRSRQPGSMHILGVGQARNRFKKAVEYTVPFGGRPGRAPVSLVLFAQSNGGRSTISLRPRRKRLWGHVDLP